jgi:hypothetical protein
MAIKVKKKFEVGNGGSNGTAIITPERPSLNFFNSSITDQNGYLAGELLIAPIPWV